MFTGIIQGLGRINGLVPMGGEFKITVEAGFNWDGPLVLGESIAVNGACLTVTEGRARTFSAHVSAETIQRTAMKDLKIGHSVNLERALKLSDRLGGHLVSGHIDGVGVIREKREQDQSIIFTFGMDKSLSKYMIEKGSVAIDGISLTINQVMDDGFSVNIIPHTAAETTLSFKKVGDCVNLETDLIGKYVARLMGLDNEKKDSGGSKVDMQFLAEHGFL